MTPAPFEGPLVVPSEQVPEEIRFAAVQDDYDCGGGRWQRTFVLYTVKGIRTRSMQRRPGDDDWFWLRAWEDGSRISWSRAFDYEGETPESVIREQLHRGGLRQIEFKKEDRAW